MDMALVSLLAVIFVFAVGAFKKNPLHLGILALFISYFIGRIAGIADAKLWDFSQQPYLFVFWNYVILRYCTG